MSVTSKALWTIERNLAAPLSLGDIAAACGSSKYHLAHAFGAATGLAVMEYVRGRRLSEAALRLAAGAPDILGLAIDSGYGSHEAFTRAFTARFAVTPAAVRTRGSVEGIAVMAAIRAPDGRSVRLAQPRIVEGKPMIIVGLSERQSFATTQAIPAQWQRFMALYGEIPDKLNPVPVGACSDTDEDGYFNYICGVEVTRVSQAPRGMSVLRVPAQTYAVFTHRDHVSTIGATYSAILDHWLPEHGKTAGNGASLERHLDSFDPRTGLGGVEIWMPLEEETPRR
jgi:AraC family transcriptional regulator